MSRLMILLPELAIGVLESTRKEFIVLSRGNTMRRRGNRDLTLEKERERAKMTWTSRDIEGCLESC